MVTFVDPTGCDQYPFNTFQHEIKLQCLDPQLIFPRATMIALDVDLTKNLNSTRLIGETMLYDTSI